MSNIFQWQKKDWVDQPLHFLVGFVISCMAFVTVFLAPIMFGHWLTPPWLILDIGFWFILSVFVGAIREESQHERWLFDLDLFVWIIGSVTGLIFVTLVTVFVINP